MCHKCVSGYCSSLFIVQIPACIVAGASEAGCAGARLGSLSCAACHSGYSKIVVFTLALHNGVFTTYSSKSLELNLPGIDYEPALLLLLTLLYLHEAVLVPLMNHDYILPVASLENRKDQRFYLFHLPTFTGMQTFSFKFT